MKIEPVGNLLIYKIIEKPNSGIAGFQEDDRFTFGEVVAVGPECKQVKVGDKITHRLERFEVAIMPLEQVADKLSNLYFVPENSIIGVITY